MVWTRGLWRAGRSFGLGCLLLGPGISTWAAGTAIRDDRLPYDPFCTLTNAGVVVPLRPLPASTRRMIEVLARIRDAAAPGSMAYLNDKLIPRIRTDIEATQDLGKRIGLRFHLGRQLVLAGSPSEGLQVFDGILRTLDELNGELSVAHASELRVNRAIAMLRLGEQENCLTNHNAESCVFPIRSGGRHRLELHCVGDRSNRAAIGTRFRVTVRTPRGPRDIFKTVNSGGSFGSSPLRQEIGLGDATSIVRVELHWPATGTRQVLTGLELDRGYRIREGDSRAVALELPRIALDLHSPGSHAHAASAR